MFPFFNTHLNVVIPKICESSKWRLGMNFSSLLYVVFPVDYVTVIIFDANSANYEFCYSILHRVDIKSFGVLRSKIIESF
jgi:hypothetical protein